MVEMMETAHILRNATPKSLIILDEIGRGTSTFDGVSIAWAVAEYLHDVDLRAAKTLFATHYHELTELAVTRGKIKNCNIAVKEWNEQIIFLRKIVTGGSSHSYGIQVARLAGLPAEVIDRAKEILGNLEKENMARRNTAHRQREKGRRRAAFSPAFPLAEEDQLRNRLKEVDIASMTPLRH